MAGRYILKPLEEQGLMWMAIGEAARRSGCTVATIRYYEEVGLIARAARSEAGRRTYSHAEVSRLVFVRRAREVGMSIPQVRELLAAERRGGGGCCPQAKAVVGKRLADIIRDRAELELLQRSLTAMLARCAAECEPDGDCCTIFDDISSPRK